MRYVENPLPHPISATRLELLAPRQIVIRNDCVRIDRVRAPRSQGRDS